MPLFIFQKFFGEAFQIETRIAIKNGERKRRALAANSKRVKTQYSRSISYNTRNVNTLNPCIIKLFLESAEIYQLQGKRLFLNFSMGEGVTDPRTRVRKLGGVWYGANRAK